MQFEEKDDFKSSQAPMKIYLKNPPVHSDEENLPFAECTLRKYTDRVGLFVFPMTVLFNKDFLKNNSRFL